MKTINSLIANAEMLIRKPVAEVFEAFANPAITSKFWFTKGRGRLEADLMAIEQVYLRGGGEFLIGLLNNKVVAMGGFKRLSDTAAELRRMRIERELQGKGYGGELLRELEHIAFKSGVRTIHLDAARARPLTLEFYRKHGYRKTGSGLYGRIATARFTKTLDATAFA